MVRSIWESLKTISSMANRLFNSIRRKYIQEFLGMGKLLLLAKLLIRKLKKVILDSLSKFLSFIFSDDYEK